METISPMLGSKRKSKTILKADEIDKKLLEQEPYPTNFAIRMVRFYFNTIGYLFPKLAARFAWKIFQTPRGRAKHKVTDDLIESAHTFFIVHNQHTIKGYSWGEGEQTVLLIHGWESRGTALRNFVPHFLAKGYRVVTFDGPAHGNSSGKQTNLINFADIIHQVILQVGGVKAIIAHSFGAFSTSYLLTKIYNKIELDQLVLVASPTKIENAINQYQHTLRIPQKVVNQWYRLIKRETRVTPKDVDITLVKMPKRIKNVLIVHDLYDNVVSIDNGNTLYENWDNASMLQTEGMGHYKLLKNEKVVSRIVDFVG